MITLCVKSILVLNESLFFDRPKSCPIASIPTIGSADANNFPFFR